MYACRQAWWRIEHPFYSAMRLAQLIFTESIAVKALQWKPSYEPSFKALMCGDCCPVWIYRYGYEVWEPIMQLVKSEAGPDVPVLGVLSHPPTIMPVEMTWLGEFMWCVWAAPGVATVTIALSPDLSSPRTSMGWDICCFRIVWCIPAHSSIIREGVGRTRKESSSQGSPVPVLGPELLLGRHEPSWILPAPHIWKIRTTISFPSMDVSFPRIFWMDSPPSLSTKSKSYIL